MQHLQNYGISINNSTNFYKSDKLNKNAGQEELSKELLNQTVVIPSASFIMGSPASEPMRNENEAQHIVNLNSFRISKFEITNIQFASFLNILEIKENGTVHLPERGERQLIIISPLSIVYRKGQWVSYSGRENHPVVNVTWYGAKMFAEFVGTQLPTETQWEYACKAGTTSPFNTGNCLFPTQANYYWSYTYAKCGNINNIMPTNSSLPVGSFPPNSFGLYDMHGNVMEWCEDWYELYPSETDSKTTTSSTSNKAKSVRGGSWFSPPQNCRSAYRN